MLPARLRRALVHAPMAWLVLALISVAPAGAAFRATAVTPGNSPLDLGRAPTSQLLFGRVAPGDGTIRASLLVPGGEQPEFELLVPDRKQERRLTEAQLPTTVLEVRDAETGQSLGVGSRPRFESSSEVRTDPATGLRFRVLARAVLDRSPSQRHVELTARPGTASVRVALFAGDGTRFELRDARRTPRTVGRLLTWYDAAPRSDQGPPARSGRDWSRAIAPALLAAAMLLLAGWWVRSGRATSRRRSTPADDVD